MTLDEARLLLAEVREAAEDNDDEAAHSAEDELHLRVLEAVADGDPQSAALARIALESGDIEFQRWCA